MNKIITAYKKSTKESQAWWQTLNINQMDYHAFKYFNCSFEDLRPLQIKYIYSIEVKGDYSFIMALRSELDIVRKKYKDKLTRNTIKDEFEAQIGKC